MTNYVTKNKVTGEIKEYSFSVKDYDKFFRDNPDLERYHTDEFFPVYSDAVRMSVPGTKTCDSVFEREIIGRIKKNTPGNRLGQYHKTHCPREW